MSVYHFTCADHGEPGIRRTRTVIPRFHPFIGAALAWFTDDPAPTEEHVGLTSSIQPCDRMAYRVTVPDHPDIVPWRLSSFRAVMPMHTLRDLERFGDPDRWFVSAYPVPAGDIVRRPRVGWDAAA